VLNHVQMKGQEGMYDQKSLRFLEGKLFAAGSPLQYIDWFPGYRHQGKQGERVRYIESG